MIRYNNINVHSTKSSITSTGIYNSKNTDDDNINCMIRYIKNNNNSSSSNNNSNNINNNKNDDVAKNKKIDTHDNDNDERNILTKKVDPDSDSQF